jgi:hypothetical protein
MLAGSESSSDGCTGFCPRLCGFVVLLQCPGTLKDFDPFFLRCRLDEQHLELIWGARAPR